MPAETTDGSDIDRTPDDPAELRERVKRIIYFAPKSVAGESGEATMQVSSLFITASNADLDENAVSDALEQLESDGEVIIDGDRCRLADTDWEPW